jgi:hypothetical protein
VLLLRRGTLANGNSVASNTGKGITAGSRPALPLPAVATSRCRVVRVRAAVARTDAIPASASADVGAFVDADDGLVGAVRGVVIGLASLLGVARRVAPARPQSRPG